MANFLITGGTGLVGSALTGQLLSAGHAVTILTRNPRSTQSVDLALQFRHWDPSKQQIDEASIRSADYIVHLAGANVADKRWTAKRKQEILNSRVQSGAFLVECLRSIPNQVQAVLGASAQGWYGADPELPNPIPFVETDPAYDDFLGQTCRLWEQSLQSIGAMGIRLIQLRIGIVLSKQGGALAEFIKPVRFGITPVLGNGKQVISWIHISDLTRMIEWSLLQPSVHGIYNAAAPEPVSNRLLMRTLAAVCRRPFIPIPVPGFLLKWILGEMSIEVLKSTTMNADKIQRAGFAFRFTRVKDALLDLLK